MKCNNCGSENPKDDAFCGNCGIRLWNTCPECGGHSPAQSNFCGSCGTRLLLPQTGNYFAVVQKYIPAYLVEKIRESTGKIEGERKEITIVFADISGFTAIAETRDPEGVSDIANRCHCMLGDAILILLCQLEPKMVQERTPVE